jgi:cytochrome P450
LAKHDDILTTFTKMTSDVGRLFLIPPILDFIYPGIQNFIYRIVIRLGLYNPTAKYRRILHKHIINQIEKRLQEKQTYGDLWKRPNDLLQSYMEQENLGGDNLDYETIVDKLCFFIFVSVHSTSRGCANAIIDLASRPEYMQELYEEQLEIHKQADENGILPFEALNEMKKLDCFIRESLRLSGSIAALQHITTKDYTFSNGLQVPKDHAVEIYIDDTIRDESSQGPNPKSFEPFRHLNKNVSASKISKSYIVFGNGKHA